MFKVGEVKFPHEQSLNDREGTTREFFAGSGDAQVHGRIRFCGLFTGDGWRPGEAEPVRWLDVELEDKPGPNGHFGLERHSVGRFAGRGEDLVKAMNQDAMSVLRLAGLVEPLEQSIVRLPAQVAQLELPVSA